MRCCLGKFLAAHLKYAFSLSTLPGVSSSGSGNPPFHNDNKITCNKKKIVVGKHSKNKKDKK